MTKREMATPQIKPLAQIKREAAANAVAYYLGDKVKAAKALGISLQTLYSYLKEENSGK